jgi:hypothetical protein
MDRQNAAFQQWFEQHLGEEGDPQLLLGHIYELLKLNFDITREQTGGLEVVQSLRAVGPLQELRLTSHRLVASQFAAMMAELLDRPVDELLSMQARLSIDTGYGIVEMALEDDTLPVEQALRQGSLMIQRYWRDILPEA